MPLDYEIDSRLKNLAPVLEDCAAWYVAAVKHLFFPESHDDGRCLVLPASFSQWLASERGSEYIDRAALEDMDGLQAALQQAVLKAGGGGKNPPPAAIDEVNDLYSRFMNLLHRVELDCVQINCGFDPFTGLRHSRAMERDMTNEMERRARKGMPFSLVLAQLDNFAVLRGNVSGEDSRRALREASVLIRKCLRAFDDAYHTQDGEFVMVLKHSDLRGGTAAIERLRGFLREEPIGVRTNKGNMVQMTMSYCVSDPQPGEVLKDLLQNMRADLQRYDDSNGKALEYIEQSPLQRFLSDTGDK